MLNLFRGVFNILMAKKVLHYFGLIDIRKNSGYLKDEKKEWI